MYQPNSRRSGARTGAPVDTLTCSTTTHRVDRRGARADGDSVDNPHSNRGISTRRWPVYRYLPIYTSLTHTTVSAVTGLHSIQRRITADTVVFVETPRWKTAPEDTTRRVDTVVSAVLAERLAPTPPRQPRPSVGDDRQRVDGTTDAAGLVIGPVSPSTGTPEAPDHLRVARATARDRNGVSLGGRHTTVSAVLPRLCPQNYGHGGVGGRETLGGSRRYNARGIESEELDRDGPVDGDSNPLPPLCPLFPSERDTGWSSRLPFHTTLPWFNQQIVAVRTSSNAVVIKLLPISVVVRYCGGKGVPSHREQRTKWRGCVATVV